MCLWQDNYLVSSFSHQVLEAVQWPGLVGCSVLQSECEFHPGLSHHRINHWYWPHCLAFWGLLLAMELILSFHQLCATQKSNFYILKLVSFILRSQNKIFTTNKYSSKIDSYTICLFKCTCVSLKLNNIIYKKIGLSIFHLPTSFKNKFMSLILKWWTFAMQTARWNKSSLTQDVNGEEST